MYKMVRSRQTSQFDELKKKSQATWPILKFGRGNTKTANRIASIMRSTGIGHLKEAKD